MSTETIECRLLLDPPADAAWNMAVDEVLLEEVAASGKPFLRFYQWSRPTLSLGYFQQFADRKLHAPSIDADLVRRLSGGGAILHDRELTYSLVLPASHELASDTQALYDAVHQTILAELKDALNASDNTWQPTLCHPSHTASNADEPFLCFERRTNGDILLSRAGATDQLAGNKVIDYKVVGSAQRRRCGTVLQHGSILLRQSEAAPELPGVVDITHSEVSASNLLKTLPGNLAAATGLKLLQVKLSEKLVQESQRLQQSKYQSADWTQRR